MRIVEVRKHLHTFFCVVLARSRTSGSPMAPKNLGIPPKFVTVRKRPLCPPAVVLRDNP